MEESESTFTASLKNLPFLNVAGPEDSIEHCGANGLLRVAACAKHLIGPRFASTEPIYGVAGGRLSLAQIHKQGPPRGLLFFSKEKPSHVSMNSGRAQ